MNFHKEFETAKKIIEEAGKIVLSYLRTDEVVRFKGNKSLPIKADIDTEDYIRSELNKHFTGYGFIGEESRYTPGEIAWIVDPLDGSISFSKGIHEFGIAIALKEENELIFSVQYLPYSKKLLYAYTGEGAYCNRLPITVGTVYEYNAAFLSLGLQNFWYPRYRDYTFSLLTKPVVRRFRVGGSSVVESFYLASGKTDISIRLDQPIWDIAAEYVLMKEAGAAIMDIRGGPLHLYFNNTGLHNYIATNTLLLKASEGRLYCKS